MSTPLSPYELNRLAESVPDFPEVQSLLMMPAKLSTLKADPTVPQITADDDETLNLILMMVNLFLPIILRTFVRPKTPDHMIPKTGGHMS